jgi:hypothetical protein
MLSLAAQDIEPGIRTRVSRALSVLVLLGLPFRMNDGRHRTLTRRQVTEPGLNLGNLKFQDCNSKAFG